MNASTPLHPTVPRRLQVQARLWGAIEVAALWRARWRQRGGQWKG